MLLVYFKTAWRNILRNKTFSTINLLGLVVGLCSSLIIYLMVSFDYSHDRFHTHFDRTYRIVSNLDFAGTPWNTAGVPGPLYQAVASEIKGIEFISPLYLQNASVDIEHTLGKKTFKNQRHIAYVNPVYFDMFQYEWMSGEKTKLADPFTVALTSEKAKMYFPEYSVDQIIGKHITLFDSLHFTIIGIIKPQVENSELVFDHFLSYATGQLPSFQKRLGLNSWETTNSNSQLLLTTLPGVTPASLQQDLARLREKYLGNKPESKGSYGVQALTDIHFNSMYGNYKSRIASHKTNNALVLIAVFLLAMGCINFINLTTAHAVARAKEIGVRKTLGSSKFDLILQILSETFMHVCIAFVVSIMVMPLFLYIFKDFIPAEIKWNDLFIPSNLIFVGGLLIAVTLLSGFYPAFILGGYQPVNVLKGKILSVDNKSIFIRKGLTLFQLIIAQVFILGTLIVLKQIKYITTVDLGFRKNAIIYIESPLSPFGPGGIEKAKSTSLAFQKELLKIPELEYVCRGGIPPSANSWSSSTFDYFRDQKKIEVNAQRKSGDSSFFSLYHIPLVAGRMPRYINDSVTELIINEAMAQKLESKHFDELLGTSFGNKGNQIIVGVCKNFNMKSLHVPIEPMVLLEDQYNMSTMHIGISTAIDPSTYPKLIEKIKAVYNSFFPGYDMYLSFLDETIASFYTSEKYISKLIRWCMFLSLLISSLGLLGLVIHTSQQKTKEIGIRKVLGASILHIVRILISPFFLVTILSILIASPIAYILAEKWLSTFAFRTDITGWLFVSSAALLILCVLSVLAARVFKTATSNPSIALKSD